MVKQSFGQNEQVPLLSEDEVLRRWTLRPAIEGPFLVYSSWARGWTDSRVGLSVGLDDHGFHRGDGVFEAIRVVARRPYLLEQHWQRLQRSMRQIGIENSMNFDELRGILDGGLALFPESEMLLRLFVTRGPGGFSTDPRECWGSCFYAVLMRFKPFAEERYRSGVSTGRSTVPVKPSWMATTKSLNYLPNVMMKREAIERGLDFVLSFDERGLLAESSTENIVLLREEGVLAFPNLDRILSGCTMLRLFELVEAQGLLPTERQAALTETDLLEAQGAWMVGTTLDAIPVAAYEGRALPLSPWSSRLRDLLRSDQVSV